MTTNKNATNNKSEAQITVTIITTALTSSALGIVGNDSIVDNEFFPESTMIWQYVSFTKTFKSL